MRVVVSDSSPLIVLVNIGTADLLRELFGEVVIPPEVEAELNLPARPQAVKDLISSRPGWLRVQLATDVKHIPSLHAGETAAIALAAELAPALLLVDDGAARKVATERGIPITGTVGILILAAEEGKIDLADAFDRVKQTDFWFPHKKLDAHLKQFRSRQQLQ